MRPMNDLIMTVALIAASFLPAGMSVGSVAETTRESATLVRKIKASL